MRHSFNYRPFIVLAVLVGGWEWALGVNHVESDTLAPPSMVLAELWRLILNGKVLVAAKETLTATLLGLALGSFLGTFIGLVSGLARPVALAIRGPVEVLRPLPAIALVPLMTITFGLGLAMEVYVIIFAVIWPCIILTQSAVRAVDSRLLEVADVLELSWFARVWKIVLPSVRPRLIVMLRFAAAIALLIAVTVELVSNPWGLGHRMMIAEEGFHPDRMLAYLVVITFMGWCLNWAFMALERYAFTLRLNSN
ncbi:ABC-type nitrate/sulfonate/bicarbonate transport system, permease component [Hoeflea sp. IMCC20628]|uniref:ABC transporter permease n=1 Tax=Hoeflea sp. IMCC20628 TaxID=1620421 RepID=UPI00063B00A0|nr:ABC transporter permease subunit [Hoeflea sp. IMCC20628]AKI02687.1 ABC-type nitrate/sulfonate/bicarbonate transport system, permease component [Hoeflea sp. IMCC20628]